MRIEELVGLKWYGVEGYDATSDTVVIDSGMITKVVQTRQTLKCSRVPLRKP